MKYPELEKKIKLLEAELNQLRIKNSLLTAQQKLLLTVIETKKDNKKNEINNESFFLTSTQSRHS